MVLTCIFYNILKLINSTLYLNLISIINRYSLYLLIDHIEWFDDNYTFAKE